MEDFQVASDIRMLAISGGDEAGQELEGFSIGATEEGKTEE